MYFRNEYDFLSNFYNCPVTYDGYTYKNNEAAFQAQKTFDEKQKYKFTKLSPSDAKRFGRSVNLREDWEVVKYQLMYEIVFAKFIQNPKLKSDLIATGKEYLCEDNDWHDKEWGCYKGVGNNHLGKILMQVREEMKVGIKEPTTYNPNERITINEEER